MRHLLIASILLFYRRMLLLIIENFNLDLQKLTQAWVKKHGASSVSYSLGYKHTYALAGKDNAPTVSAIQQHMAKVKKKAGAGTTQSIAALAINGTSIAAKKIAATPKKSAMAHTPLSSSKRDRSAMSDEDDSEPDADSLRLAKNGSKRASISRSTKKPKTYNEPASESEEGDDEADGAADANGDPVANNEKLSDIFKNDMSFDGASDSELRNVTNGGFGFGIGGIRKAKNLAAPNGIVQRKRATYLDSMDDSDASNISDGLN